MLGHIFYIIFEIIKYLSFLINCPEKCFCTYVYIKQIFDQNVHVSISKKEILIYNA